MNVRTGKARFIMIGGKEIEKTITIFGGTRDLTFRKLLPAMYNMHVTGARELGMI